MITSGLSQPQEDHAEVTAELGLNMLDHIDSLLSLDGDYSIQVYPANNSVMKLY